jgi:LmbE family N-acetylglucosaminyl deacetylase
VNLPTPARALAIGAHSDDAEFGCGATLAKWAAGGTEVHLCVLTDGSKGTWDADADIDALVATRHDEQQAAATALGLTAVHFFDLVDGELQGGREERAALCELIRRLRPEIVVSHDPWKRYRLHPDHRAAGHLTIDAIVAARDPHFFPERGQPHRPGRLLLFEAEDVDHTEDVEGYVDTKVAALLCHRTQWRNTMGIDPDRPDPERFAAQIRAEAEAAGAAAGLALGEPFKLVEPL